MVKMALTGIEAAGLYLEPSTAGMKNQDLTFQSSDWKEELQCLLQSPQLVSLLGVSTDRFYSSAWTFPGRVTSHPQVLTSLKLILWGSALPHLNCFLQLGPHV